MECRPMKQQLALSKTNNHRIGANTDVSGKQFQFPDYSTYVDSYLPIEFNVPDTAISIWHGAEMAWISFSDYFSQQTPMIISL